MQKVQALCWGQSLHCTICPLFCMSAITPETGNFPGQWLLESRWGKIHLRWKIWDQVTTTRLLHAVTFPAFRDYLCQDRISHFLNPCWASCVLHSTTCIIERYIVVIIILKCSRVLYYTTQVRFSSCCVFCIFLIVALVFNSVPVYEYSKNHKLYHRRSELSQAIGKTSRSYLEITQIMKPLFELSKFYSLCSCILCLLLCLPKHSLLKRKTY